MSATNYLEKKLLDHALGVASYTMPTTLFLALCTADPGEAATGSEVTGGSYAPKAITFDGNAGGTSLSNNTQLFTNMPAVTVTFFVVRDAAGGNGLFVGPLATPQVMTAGQSLAFNPGQIAIGAD